ncbi:MAG: 5'/3'-nucleotidase SurE [Bacteroidales bacterium]|nr:5'/3'-nucleotidase SurE [Bacteroidales bacterium]MCB9013651.1 5'/3'-nucleotidase SurE [Bacteroidales bacterium]
MSKEKLILISNDDGVEAKGIKALIEAASHFGKVVVVAPADAMSGMSHAITIKTPLRAKKIRNTPELEIYRAHGTPVDCVKLAMNQLLEGRVPDLVLSGINHGSNASSSVVYSGTMAAAMEGCINQIPSAGFSLLSYDPDADFSAAVKVAEQVIEKMLAKGLPEGICLNVNIPSVPYSDIKGIRVCRQAKGLWKEEFVKRVDPNQGEYYWLTGYYLNLEEDSEDTDEHALANNFASIVPIQIDFTAYQAMNEISGWDL